MYVAFGALITMLLVSSRYRATQEPDTRTFQDFYRKTMNAIDKKSGQQRMAGTYVYNPNEDEDDEAVARAMAERLKLAEQKARSSANSKGPHKPDAPEDVVGVGSSASGQVKKGDGKEKVIENDEDHEVETELNSILKKSPGEVYEHSVEAWMPNSHSDHLLQVILPALVEGEDHLAG